MAATPFNWNVYQEAQSLLASNPLALRGKHLGQLSLFHGELRHAQLAIEIARRKQTETLQRQGGGGGGGGGGGAAGGRAAGEGRAGGPVCATGGSDRGRA